MTLQIHFFKFNRKTKFWRNWIRKYKLPHYNVTHRLYSYVCMYAGMNIHMVCDIDQECCFKHYFLILVIGDSSCWSQEANKLSEELPQREHKRSCGMIVKNILLALLVHVVYISRYSSTGRTLCVLEALSIINAGYKICWSFCLKKLQHLYVGT